MITTDYPFSLEIPLQIGNLRFVFFLSDHLYASGEKCEASPHNHSNYELCYTVSGFGEQTVENKLISTKAGDVLLIHPQEYHCQGAGGIGAGLARYSIRFLVKHPSEKATAQQKKSYAALTDALQSIRLITDSDMLLLPTFQKLEREIVQQQYGYYNHLQAMCIILFTDLIRLSGITETGIFPPTDQMYSSYWNTQLDFFFGSYYMENIKLDDLAAFLRVSARQASRIVIREHGTSYTQKLLEYRLQKAKFQLAHTEKELHRVSADCGFQSYTYFTTCFRRATGLTPTEYREMGGGQDPEAELLPTKESPPSPTEL